MERNFEFFLGFHFLHDVDNGRMACFGFFGLVILVDVDIELRNFGRVKMNGKRYLLNSQGLLVRKRSRMID